MNQKFSYIFGALYLIIGAAGFAVTTGVAFAAKHSDQQLFVFALNPLHNIVHILIGIALLVCARRPADSRIANFTIGFLYAFVGLVGIFVANGTNGANLLALNQPDNGLHLATAILALGIAFSERPVEA